VGAEPGGRRPAIFLDRDGTLHEELPHPIADPRDLRVFPGAREALERLSRAGYVLAIVSNQSAIARGELDHERLARVHAALRTELAPAVIAGIFVCPHDPRAGLAPYFRPCPCRKPSSGLFLDAARELALDLGRSWVIGDAARDLEAGANVGARPVLVATGKGPRERAKLGAELAARTAFAPTLAAAADAILAR
jgi:D-glycero-D-manno-heptose 1,7-bisphosphate phosphatase